MLAGLDMAREAPDLDATRYWSVSGRDPDREFGKRWNGEVGEKGVRAVRGRMSEEYGEGYSNKIINE